MSKNNKDIRIGKTHINNQGCLMKIVEYNKAIDIVIEFQDENKTKVHTNYAAFIKGKVRNPLFRIGKESINYQGCLMKIIEYVNCDDIVVEFQDKYKCKVHTRYDAFLNNSIKNPYFPTVNNIGIVGAKYDISINGKHTKEYEAWSNIIDRCYNQMFKEKNPAYKDTVCCNEWLLYENFYEWLHEQDNFDKWFNGNRWHIDKDILVKGNKIYSPHTCCLVPVNINSLFTKCDKARGNYPIGVCKNGIGFQSWCSNQIIGIHENLGTYPTPEQAFLVYKKRKEEIIKQVAEIEYSKGNIIKKCYDAMMNYQVEITD